MSDGNAVELATGYVALIPSAKGIAAGITRELGGPLESAAATAGASTSKSFSGRFSSGVKGLGKGIATGLLAGGLAFAAIGGGVLKLGTDFKSAYNEIRVESGATGKSLNGLEGDFRAVLSQRPENMQQVALAISKLHQGLDLTGPSLQEMAKQVLRLSAITKTDLGTNLTSVTGLFNNFGVAAAQQPGKLDELFRASQVTGISVSDLASTMSRLGSPLRQAGLSFEDSAALLGLLTKSGISAASIMPALSKSIALAAKEGKSASSVFRDTFNAIRTAPSATKAAGDAIKVFGARAGPNLAGLIRQGKLSYQQLAATIAHGGDTIAKAATATAGFTGKWKIFLNQLRVAVEPVAIAAVTFAIAAMTAAAPYLQRFADVVHGVAVRIAAFFAANPSAKFITLAVVIGSVLLGAVVGVATKLAAFVSPALLIVVAIAAIAAGAIYAYKHFSNFRAIVDQLRARVIAIATGAIPVLRAAFGSVVGFVTQLVSKLRSVDFAAIFGRVLQIINPVISGVKSLALALFPLAKSLLPVLASAFRIAFAVAKAALPPLVVAFYLVARAAGLIFGTALKLVSAIARLLAANMKTLKPILLAAAAGFVAFTAVKGTISLFRTVSSAATSVGKSITGLGSKLAAGGSKITGFFKAGGGSDTLRLRFMQVGDAVKSAGSKIASGATTLAGWGKTALTAAASTVKNVASLVAQKAAAVAAAVAQKAMAAAQWLLNAAMDANPFTLIVIAIVAFVAIIVLAYTKVGWFRDLVKKAFAFIQTAISAAFNWVKKNWPLLLAILTGPIGIAVLVITKNWATITAGFTAVKDWIGARITDIVGFFTALPGRLAGIFSSLWGGLTLGISAAKQWVSDRIDDVIRIVQGIPDRISSITSGMFDGIKNAAKAAFNGIATIWNDTAGKLSFHIPGWVPGIGGDGFDVPKIPLLATGTVATSPMLAMIGESAKARPEIVAPGPMIASILRTELHRSDRAAKRGPRAVPLIGGNVEFHVKDARDAMAELSWYEHARGA